MRTTLGVFVSLAAGASCAPIGHTGGTNGGPDAGTGSSTAKCTDENAVAEDWTITTADGFGKVPTSCYHLDGTLTLKGAAITSLSKLGDIRGVKSLVLDSTALTRIDSQQAISVTESLTVKNNAKLTSLAGLEIASDATIGGIAIEQNAVLADFGQVNMVSIVTGATIIDNNAKLVTLDLSNLERAEGGLSIHDNAAMTTIKLDALSSVTGDMSIKNNAVLANLGSWAALEYIHGSLIIDTNPNLVSLDSAMAQPMTEIFQLTINNNAKMNSIGQLDHTGFIDTTMVITNNPALSFCEIREVGCCVAHTGQTLTGNLGTSCNSGPHSWCYAQSGNTCPYAY